MFFRIKPVAIAGIVVLCMALAAGSFYIYFRSNVRRIFNARISALTNYHVEARKIQAEFPSTFLIDGLSVEGVMECDRAKVSVDVLSLLGRDVRIRSIELNAPIVLLENKEVPVAPIMPRAALPAAVALSKVRSVILSTLVVHDGIFKIRHLDAQGIERVYVLDRVQLRASRVPLTDTPARTEFFLTASLLKLNVPFIGYFLKMDGWLNVHAYDMEARGQVVDDDGRIGLAVNLLSRQNDMQVSGTVRLTALQGPQAVGKKVGLMEDVVLSALTSTDTDLDVGFSFRTKMDHVKVEKVHLSGRITTGLNSLATSGNIVAGLEALGAELFNMPASSP